MNLLLILIHQMTALVRCALAEIYTVPVLLVQIVMRGIGRPQKSCLNSGRLGLELAYLLLVGNAWRRYMLYRVLSVWFTVVQPLVGE